MRVVGSAVRCAHSSVPLTPSLARKNSRSPLAVRLAGLALQLPANSVAEVRLPGRPHDWLEGGQPLGHAAQRLIGSEDSHFVVELGSGNYDLRKPA